MKILYGITAVFLGILTIALGIRSISLLIHLHLIPGLVNLLLTLLCWKGCDRVFDKL